MGDRNRLKSPLIVSMLSVLIVAGLVYFVYIEESIGISDSTVAIQNEPKNQVGFQGNFYIQLIDEYGNVKEVRQSPNLVVDTGFAAISDLIHGTALSADPDEQFDTIEIGTGSTAPVLANTDIETPIGGCARITDGTVVGELLSGGYNATIEVTFSGATCAATVTEAAVFNHLTTGEMAARSTFAGIVVGAGDSLIVEYNMTGT